MHELSIVTHLVDTAEVFAKQMNAKKVDFLEVEIGEATGVIPKYVHMYYPDVTKDTLLEGSELRIEESEYLVFCRNCGRTFHPENRKAFCPSCGVYGDFDVLQGDNLTLKQIGYE